MALLSFNTVGTPPPAPAIDDPSLYSQPSGLAALLATRSVLVAARPANEVVSIRRQAPAQPL